MTKAKNLKQKQKTPWPTKAAMEQVYTMQLWGSNATGFYSGEGSHLPSIVAPYIKEVGAFLSSFKTPLTVCDLGCGDFNIGKQLVKHTKSYVGVDIVEGLIKHNQQQFTSDNLQFKCLDIAVDDLPVADCVIIRQVLQHLSNTEIQSILTKLLAFKYIVLTEHLPNGDFVPNKDIISGQGIRLKKKSGVNLLAPPFDFKVKQHTQLLSCQLDNNKGVIVTTIYEVF